MSGSDIDIMYVVPFVHVYEDINKVRFNSRETSFVMDMDDCKLGFTHLRLVKYNHPNILQWCKQIGDSSYLSNELLKTHVVSTSEQSGIPHHVHGPCASDIDDIFDLATCFHSRQWISPAYNSIKRPNHSWPSGDVKSKIIKDNTSPVVLINPSLTNKLFKNLDGCKKFDNSSLGKTSEVVDPYNSLVLFGCTNRTAGTYKE